MRLPDQNYLCVLKLPSLLTLEEAYERKRLTAFSYYRFPLNQVYGVLWNKEFDFETLKTRVTLQHLAFSDGNLL